MSRLKSILKAIILGVPEFSPRALLTRSLVAVVLFSVCHLAGLREYTSVLCGMPAQAGISKELAAYLGVAYVITYFMMVIGVPILVIGAGIFRVALTLLSPKE